MVAYSPRYPVKILIVTGIFPPDIGGPATYVPQIAKGLAGLGHEIEIITLSDSVCHDDTVYPFKVIRIPRKMFKPLRMVKTILRIIYSGRGADLLFVHGLALETALANLVLKKRLVIKVVGDLAWEQATNRRWTSDTFETFQKRQYGWKVELLKALRAWWTCRADRVIVPSRYLALWVEGWGVPKDKITVIYNALAASDKVKTLPVPLTTAVKAVTVGRLVPWKRVNQLLVALKDIPHLGLVIVGDGPERPFLEYTAQELGVMDRVYFAGQRPKNETLGLMAACDFFVLNSTYEGLPHVVLEAMALGLPVAATAVGGTTEVIRDGETGLLMQIDGTSLKGVLKLLSEDARLRRRLGEAACFWVRKRLGFTQLLELTEAALLGADWSIYADVSEKSN